MKANCKNCGKEFEQKKTGPLVYCSKPCFYKHRKQRPVLICEFCGKGYQMKYSKPKKQTRHCSYACASRARLRKYHEKNVLAEDIKKMIRAKGRYMNWEEICNALGIGVGTVSGFGISVVSMNRECGFKQNGFGKGGSLFETKVFEILEKYFDVERHKKFDTCLSPRGFKLEFDFLLNNAILVEADGIQHHDINSLLYDPYMKECDNIKNGWCRENGFPLVRISYRPRFTEKYVLRCLRSQANHNVIGDDRRDGSKNCLDMDNQQRSLPNVKAVVGRNVQRLTGEDFTSDNPDTSARHADSVMI